MSTDSAPARISPGAERMRRHRQRRRNRMRSLTLELREAEIDALIRCRRLDPDSRDDLSAVRQALYGFLEDNLG
jgi:hypothetical protein